jgi:uncharacterized Fe-S cluster-containing radical SAM superfamily enzyme
MIQVDENSGIPLFGLDFLGILDRGTNVLEVKMTTICNLKCGYCFVSAGDYQNNFIIDHKYLIDWIRKAIQLKGVAPKETRGIEIHLAPYGEILTYPDLFELIHDIRSIPGVGLVTAQSNGLLLTPESIKQLEQAGLFRINISLNSLDPVQCARLCGVSKYDLTHLLKMFDLVLKSSMELLIAPVWFMGKNDQGIMDIISYVKRKEEEGFQWPKLRLGIQNYLTYKTGRKLNHIHSRDFSYFYQRLQNLEKQFGLKLKLGPRDFDIRDMRSIPPPVSLDDQIQAEIVFQGRWKNEYIGRLSDQWAIKILTQRSVLKGQRIPVTVIKGNLSGNLLTGVSK